MNDISILKKIRAHRLTPKKFNTGSNSLVVKLIRK